MRPKHFFCVCLVKKEVKNIPTETPRLNTIILGEIILNETRSLLLSGSAHCILPNISYYDIPQSRTDPNHKSYTRALTLGQNLYANCMSMQLFSTFLMTLSPVFNDCDPCFLYFVLGGSFICGKRLSELTHSALC